MVGTPSDASQGRRGRGKASAPAAIARAAALTAALTAAPALLRPMGRSMHTPWARAPCAFAVRESLKTLIASRAISIRPQTMSEGGYGGEGQSTASSRTPPYRPPARPRVVAGACKVG
ncbi:hypothetical protein EV714DRAFT_278381 [Schizophyllum commune]